MIVKISGSPLDWINEAADQFVDWEAEKLAQPLVHLAKAGILYAVHTLNTFSVEIITLSIVVCGFGMMVGPMIGAENRWLGRLFTVTLGGVIWRLII